MEFKILNALNDDIIKIREEAFVFGRNVPRNVEFDGKDCELLHFCIYKDGNLLAYLRAEDIGELLHIGRVCVKKDLRGQGLGYDLINFISAYAIYREYTAIELSAVDTAVGFYEKNGFVAEGDFYPEAGAPHIYMKKTLLAIDSYIKRQLFLLRDEAYRDFHSRLMPTINSQKIIGVRTPQLRALAKELIKNPQIEDFFHLPHTYYEENNLHAFLIEQIKDFSLCKNRLDEFLPYVDNWATCDMLRPKCFEKNKDKLIPWIDEMLTSKKVYTVRYAIGLLMRHFLKEDFKYEYLKKVADAVCDEYYVNMMVAWYFAEALAVQYSSAVILLEQKLLPYWVHNKSIQKAIESRRILPEQKDYLRSLRIKQQKIPG